MCEKTLRCRDLISFVYIIKCSISAMQDTLCIWERESKGKTEKQSKRAEDSLSVFFAAEESSPVALKRGIILSSKQTFGYSWLAEQLCGPKEDRARMGLNIKVNLRRAGLEHESTKGEPQRSSRGVLEAGCLVDGQRFEWLWDEGLLKAIQKSAMVWHVHLFPNLRNIHKAQHLQPK